MSRVEATFAVHAGAWREVEIDTTGMTIDEVADQVQDKAEPPSLCYQCAHDLSDPELQEVTSLVIDGVEYVPGPEGWHKYEPPVRGNA